MCSVKKKLRTAAIVILLLVFVGSLARVAYQAFQYKEGDEIYSEAEELVNLPDFSDLPALTLPDSSAAPSGSTSQEEQAEEVPVYVDPYADALRNMDFSALQEVNSDVLGWILIPGTNISYPVVQGSDNSYYLNHTWKKTRNSVGAIFVECQNSRDLSDFNTIIYGHRMNNRSMFGTLSQYKNKSYWSQHPYIYITDDNGTHRYEIFAAYEVSVEGATYQLGFSGDASRQSFIDFCLGQSVIDTGVVPNVYDRVVTLSTCTGNGHATRWVVQGVLRGEAPPDEPEDSGETPAGDAEAGGDSSAEGSASGSAGSDSSAGGGTSGSAGGDSSAGDGTPGRADGTGSVEDGASGETPEGTAPAEGDSPDTGAADGGAGADNSSGALSEG